MTTTLSDLTEQQALDALVHGDITEQEFREMFPPECNCVLPEQSCPACRAAAAQVNPDDEFPY